MLNLKVQEKKKKIASIFLESLLYFWLPFGTYHKKYDDLEFYFILFQNLANSGHFLSMENPLYRSKFCKISLPTKKRSPGGAYNPQIQPSNPESMQMHPQRTGWFLFYCLCRSKWKDIQMDLEMGQSLVSLDSRVIRSPLQKHFQYNSRIHLGFTILATMCFP
jgi:hypothetical protein